MISFNHVSKANEKGNPILSDINLTINKGEFVNIVGTSGSGKSTLLKLIFLKEKSDDGEIIINEVNVTKLKRSEIPKIRRNIGFIFQNSYLMNRRTVFENIAIPLKIAGLRKEEVKSKVSTLIKRLGLENRSDNYPPNLSYSEQQKVCIARSFINKPSIILADEPFNGLDSDTAIDVFEILREAHEIGTTIIFATNQRVYAKMMPKRVIYLKDGKVAEDL